MRSGATRVPFAVALRIKESGSREEQRHGTDADAHDGKVLSGPIGWSHSGSHDSSSESSCTA